MNTKTIDGKTWTVAADLAFDPRVAADPDQRPLAPLRGEETA